MRSEYPNLLSLTEFCELMGLNPWHMAGFCAHVPTPSGKSGCTGYWFEYTYQNDALARQDVSVAVMQAEEMFAEKIGYYPAPFYTVGESHPYPRGVDDLIVQKRTGLPKSIMLNYGRFIQAGVEICTKVADVEVERFASPAASEVPTGNGTVTAVVKDKITGTFVLPEGATVDQIRVFYTELDRDYAPKEQWEIRPVLVTPAGLNATITGNAWQFVKPTLLTATDKGGCFDTLDNEVFVTSVEVWWCRTDTTMPGHFAWEQGGCGLPNCEDATQPFCFSVRLDPCTRAAPFPAAWDEDLETFRYTPLRPCRVPNKAVFNYLSGVPRLNGKMERQHAQIIAMLAASLLECSICACDCTKARLDKYSAYETYQTGEGMSLGDKGNTYSKIDANLTTFGQKHGQVLAWRQAESKKYQCLGSVR